MPDLIYPTSAELDLIAQDLLPRLTAARPIFARFPMVAHDAAMVLWEQEDNYTGLQQVRGMNGAPPRVNRVGLKRYASQPGIYGEYLPLDERTLTERRQYGTFGTPVDVQDLVADAQRQLLQRRLDRVESIIWTLLTTGTFAVTGPSGAVLATDSYTTQTFSAAINWSSQATSTPLADMRAIQLKHRGHSVDFGVGAEAYINRVTLNQFLSNTNAADLGGRRGAGLSTINGPEQLNQLLAMDDLPTLVVYDQGYLDDTSTFQPFIPDGDVVVIGRRADNAPIGEYQLLRNANNPGMGPGPYMKVIDTEEREVPRSVQVHDGHNGGPAIRFPSAVVAMSVS